VQCKYFVPLIPIVREVIFYASKTPKHIIGDFEGFFEVKKVKAPSKSLEKSSMMCFASIQEICTGVRPFALIFIIVNCFLSIFTKFGFIYTCGKCAKNIARNPRKHGTAGV
jgi:hypothetical protein